MGILILTVVIVLGTAIGTYFFIKNNKNKVAKLEAVGQKVEDKVKEVVKKV